MKNRFIRSFAALLIIFTLTAGPAIANEPQVSVAAKLGTLGLGIDIDVKFSPYFNGRVGLGALKWGFNTTVDDLKYDYDMSLYTVGLLLDWHPAASGFRVTGGVIINTHDISAKTTPDANEFYTIGDVSYPGAALGEVSASAEYNAIAPYVGVGYGADFGDGNWSFHMDLGVMWWGSPKVDLSSTTEDQVPGLSEELDKEAKKAEDELKFLQWYPVLSIGVSYRF